MLRETFNHMYINVFWIRHEQLLYSRIVRLYYSLWLDIPLIVVMDYSALYLSIKLYTNI